MIGWKGSANASIGSFVRIIEITIILATKNLGNIIARIGLRNKMHLRVCKRCGKPFRTPAKFGKFCESCHKPHGGGKLGGGSILKKHFAVRKANIKEV